MSAPATIPHAHLTTSHRTIHLACAAHAHENVEDVVATITALALVHGHGGPFTLHHRCPKPRTIGSNALIFTDHPSRLTRLPQDLLALITGLLKVGAEIHIVGYFDVKPNTEAASVVLQIDEMRRTMRSARIREGLYLAKQRGVRIGRKRIDCDLVLAMAAKGERGSYRAAAKSLSSQGIEISKSALHSIVSGPR